MVRQLLGNIKGPQGEIGPKGDTGDRGLVGPPGTLENEAIGVVNKIDITKLKARGGTEKTASYDYDIDSGVVNYSNVEWYLSQDVVLNGVKHVFRLEDFLSNPNYATGRINVQLLDSNRTNVSTVLVTPKNNVVIDLTGRDRQEYEVQIRVTNTEIFSGFIEKPMLVEGDVSVLWTPPTVSDADYHLTANLTGSIPYSGNLSDKAELTLLGSPDGWNSNTKQLTLPGPGTYQIFVSVTPSTTETGMIQVDIRNGTTVLNAFRGTSPNTVVGYSTVSTISAIPRINVVVAQSIKNESINLMGSSTSKIFIKKLPN